jgi:hypothetical protein
MRKDDMVWSILYGGSVKEIYGCCFVMVMVEQMSWRCDAGFMRGFI